LEEKQVEEQMHNSQLSGDMNSSNRLLLPLTTTLARENLQPNPHQRSLRYSNNNNQENGGQSDEDSYRPLFLKGVIFEQ
jgi:hypothetical protein